MKYIDQGDGVFTIDFEGEKASVRPIFYNERPLVRVIHIPEGTTELQDHAFSMCYQLQTVYMPKSVTTLGDAVFYGTSQRIEVYYAGTKEEFLSLAAPYLKIVSVQVPGPYDHQPYNMTDGTYYEDRKEWQAFNHFAGHIVVITADGARLRYGYSRSDE